MWSPICGALFLCYPVNRRGINRELEERRKMEVCIVTDINRPDPNLINEYIYSTKEVAEKIGIKDVTVRKYSQALEKHGYQIFKDGNDRKFYERDIEVLKRLSAGVFENNKS